MHAAQNYIYIVFAILYIIYSIIKAGKKVAQNKPTVSPSSAPQKKEEFKPIQPPVSAPFPQQDPASDMKKMLEDLLGGGNKEMEIPKQETPQPKPQHIKSRPSGNIAPSHKKEKMTLSHMPAKSSQKAKATPFLTAHPAAKQAAVEPIVEEEATVDFDIREAIIYSEILKRPQY